MSKLIDCFYYLLYNSVLLGNSEHAKAYCHFLKEEYEKDEHAFDFLEEDGRWDTLAKLIETVKNGLVVKNFDYDATIQELQKIEADDDNVDYEKELLDLVRQCQPSLAHLLGASESFRISNLQHPTNFGRVDVVAQDGMTVYVIELKRGIAKHDIVGQIDKYVLDFKLKLMIKHWNRIVSVTIANGYSAYARQELIRHGIVPLRYSYKDNILKLTKT